MTAKEVLYDSETLLRLVDSEMEELRGDLLPDQTVSVPYLKLISPEGDSEQQAEADIEADAELLRSSRRP